MVESWVCVTTWILDRLRITLSRMKVQVTDSTTKHGMRGGALIQHSFSKAPYFSKEKSGEFFLNSRGLCRTSACIWIFNQKRIKGKPSLCKGQRQEPVAESYLCRQGEPSTVKPAQVNRDPCQLCLPLRPLPYCCSSTQILHNILISHSNLTSKSKPLTP